MYHMTSCRNKPLKRLGAVLMTGFLLFVLPLNSMAQDISWDPLSMVFPDVVVSTTASQTLTLTNEDAALPVSIDGIEWTWNQIGINSLLPQYDFETDRPIPTSLLPGESMAIAIMFTPDEAFSFANANLLITNTSANASPLNYWVDGSGAEGDACAPLISCDGSCVQEDLNNCGACGVVCTAPENASDAACESSTCVFTCNEGYELVGDACLPIIVDPPDQTLEEMMIDLMTYVHQSLNNGTLQGLGPGKSADHKLDVFLGWLVLTDDFINNINPYTGEPEPDLVSACDRLDRIQLRCDGGWPFYSDFVAGESASAVRGKVLDIMGAIEGCEASPAPTRR